MESARRTNSRAESLKTTIFLPKEILKKKEEVKCLLQYARTQKCSTSTSNATNTRGLTQQVRVDQL